MAQLSELFIRVLLPHSTSDRSSSDADHSVTSILTPELTDVAPVQEMSSPAPCSCIAEKVDVVAEEANCPASRAQKWVCAISRAWKAEATPAPPAEEEEDEEA